VRNVVFRNKALEVLEKEDDPAISEAVTVAYRKRMQVIRAARDERDFYQLKSFRYEKLKGDRAHQHSMRLNDQFRLILEYEGTGADKTVVVVSIEDYH
jgi:proteic killer suppression protein